MPSRLLSLVVPIAGSLLVALAGIFVFWRSRRLQTIEKRLSDFYSPLYFHVAKISNPRDFWRFVSVEQWQTEIYPVLLRSNYLASEKLLSFLTTNPFNAKAAPQSDDSSNEFVNIILQDYTRLREEYLKTRKWFLPL